MRRQLSGWLIFLSLIWYVVASFASLPLFPSVILCWVTVLMVWPGLNRTSKIQSLSLFLIGIVLLLVSLFVSGHIDWWLAMHVNLPLVMMFAGITFLTANKAKTTEDKRIPKGQKGALSTLATCHFIGGIINLSILFIVGDRLSEKARKLTPTQAAFMSRGFCGAALWSPFFMGGAVALNYSPGAKISHYIGAGLIMVIPMALLTMFDTYRFKTPPFEGYPLSLDSLTLPAFLAVAVMIGHYFDPNMSTILLITIVAPIGAILFVPMGEKVEKSIEVVGEKIPRMSGQFALFMAAGVFSIGIASILHHFSNINQLLPAQFTSVDFILVGVVMTLVSIFGVHPIITISLISPFLQYMQVNPNEMVFLFVTAWAIATAISPLSSVGMMLTEHYNVPRLKYMKVQRLYSILMWIVAALVAKVYF
ncbi:hypothetical protein M9194_13390 [Vibrio sp. S4M6]|uniref:hypothetical protein n=1 Tax=Vibrio sinus TaxID=2946865 RepID=UPI00202A591F|nr:hypothetical protein [Vibrio sinus]MCL9782422.1 hypothetical protein [Vibrio sinus]